MIKFSSHTIPLNELWNEKKPKFVKVAQTIENDFITQINEIIEKDGWSPNEGYGIKRNLKEYLQASDFDKKELWNDYRNQSEKTVRNTIAMTTLGVLSFAIKYGKDNNVSSEEMISMLDI